MAKVGDQAYTERGIGKIAEEIVERGSKSYRVAGKGFSLWITESKLRVANEGGNVGFGYQDWAAPYQDDEHQQMAMLGGLESTIIPGTPYTVNEKNHTTLPYNPTPQFHTDLYRRDGTILPGENEIDADDRLHPSDSLSGKNRTEPRGPQSNPDLFLPRDDHPFADQRTSARHPEPDWSGGYPMDPDTGEDLSIDPRPRGINPDYLEDGTPVPENPHRHPLYHDSARRPAGLSDRYAFVPTRENPFDKVAQFRRDPVGFIRTCGHLWTDGDHSLEKFADYTAMLDADAIEAGGIERTAAWADVRAKAMRLRHEGKVSINEMDHQNIYATVEGDHGTYDVLMAKNATNQGIQDWACSCEWGRWAFKRQMTYVGRLCSHAYAAYQELQSAHHQGNPGSFKAAGASVDQYKGYLSDNNMAPEESSIATFLNTQGNDASKDEVEKLYDHVHANPDEVPERNFKVPYLNDPDKAYKQADLLRTTPQSLSPNLRQVPKGDGQKWVDVTSDDRETTDPDSIVHFSSLMDDLHGGHRQADVLQQLRDLDEPDEDLGHMEERNDHVRDLVERAEDEGYGASQFVAAVDDKEDGPSDGNGDFLGQSSPGFPDQGYSGSGPTPKDWFSDSATYVDDNEREHHSPADWHAPDSSDIVKFNDSRSKPQQGPRHGYRQADNFNPSSTFAGGNPSPMPPDPGLGGGGMDTDSGGDSGLSDNITATLHSAAPEDSTGALNPNNAGDAAYEQGSGEGFADALNDVGDTVTDAVSGGGMPGGGGGNAAEGEAAEGAGGAAGLLSKMPIVANGGADFDPVAAFDQGGFDVTALHGGGGDAPDGGELRRAQRIGGGPKNQVRIDPGFRRDPNQRQASAPPPEDFGYDGGREFESYLQVEDDGRDIVAQFHANGGGGVMQQGGPARQASTDDFSSSPMVQSFLRTAGRKFTEAEQRHLEGEFHPEGARNMPTPEDLAGTHYLL